MKHRMVSHYKILACLGGGAMGTVYKAEDTLLHRPVALKFLPADLTEDEEASRRFMREARATSTLDHPNICTIHEIAQADDGSWFIAMAWYEGKTLKRVLRDGPLPADQALGLANQIAQGLGQAHDHGVVHRDIKPANLIVTDDGTLKILDFGLARLLGLARLTRTGTVMGTAAYMSPEQARGEDVDTSSDIWSLGIVLYEMLTGRVPYDGESDVAMIYAVLNTDPAPLPEPEGREARICHDIINHCLVPNPKDRYPTAHVLAEDIDNATDGSKTSYHSRPSHSSIFARTDGRRWPMFVPAALAALLLVALVIPQSRGFLRSVTGIGVYDRLGVAMAPFVFEGGRSADVAFGRGLSASVTERLVNFEPHTDKFWVVPLEEILRRQITDEKRGRDIEGADRVITGVGSVVGDTISLTLTVHDTKNENLVTREFRDLGGNLKTWQDELPAWVAGVIEPGFELPPGVSPRPRGTNIPSAFLHFQPGMGYLTHAQDGRPTPQTAEAIPHLEQSVAADSSFTCAWTHLGRAVWLRDRNDETKGVKEAEEYLSTAVRLDPAAVWAHSYLGDLNVWLGENDIARDHFQRALFYDPQHVPTLNKLAGLYMSEGRMEEAETLYQRSVRIRPRYPRAHRDLGLLKYYESDYEGAREKWEEWARLAPDDFAAYSLLGVASFELGDYPHAEKTFLRSLEIEPSYAVYENLATLYYYDQRYVDSIAMVRKALVRKPDEFTAWRTLARASKFAPGHEDSAMAAFEKALELVLVQRQQYPKDPDLMSDHASFCAILGPREKSLDLLKKLETEYPELEAGILFSIASTYEELGERERSLDWLETAVEKELSFRKMDNYPVLKNLQTHPRYIALRKKYEE